MTYLAESMPEPTREDVDRLPGWTLVEFGAAWCPHCRGVQPELKRQLDARADIRHLKIEDGPGRPLGRSFRVKLWPTLVLLRDGAIVQQVVRPDDAELERLVAAAGP